MRIAVIVPTLNEAEVIEAALASLQPFRAAGNRVVVVDGDSADRTAALAAPLADAVVASARGRARQMNAGASAIAADAYLFLHADTTLPEGAADAVATALGAGMCVWGRFDVAIAGRSRWLPLIAATMNLRSRLTGIATGDQAIFVTREAFQSVGGYPKQPLMEDVELSRSLRRIGAPACLRATVLTSGRRWERNGVWRTILLMWRLRALYWLGVSPNRLARRWH